MATPAQLYNSGKPVVALIGRVNVGKSTFFNKVTEEDHAIVSNVPGTTRTSNVGTILWRGKESEVIDTGGLTFQDDVPLEEEIIRQTEMAIERADVLMFLTDGSNSILPQEHEIARMIKKSKKPCILIANKIDNSRRAAEFDIGEWLSLGLGDPLHISAASGRGVGDALDALYELFESLDLFQQKEPNTETDPDLIKISIIGKPNVGKSSLFNKLIGEERVIVSDMAHTTREPHDTDMTYESVEGEGDDAVTTPYRVKFIDTAGIRRKNKVIGLLERAGIGKSLDQIDRSDIVLLVLDGTEPISSQDKQLGGLLERRSKSVIIIVNKWDLAEDTSTEQRNHIEKMIHAHFAHLKYAPILFVSGLTGLKVHQIFPTIIKAWHGRHTHVANRALEDFLREAMFRRLPTRGKGVNHPKLLGMRQINDAPPIFEVFVKAKTSLHRSYLNYLENRLRERYDFTATPIVIKLTKVKR
jgi:GTP-binding protein